MMAAADRPTITTPVEAPEFTAVRSQEQLDWPALEAHLRAEISEIGPAAMDVMQFPNGAANLTYLLRFGPLELVMRRPPFGIIAPGAHDMKREFKVLSRLWRHFPLAPRAYLLCTDHEIIGADFFVMERRTGEVMRNVIPTSMRHHMNAGHRMGCALVDAMADMHQLDSEACELADLGKPEGFNARQVTGWTKRWELARPAEGLPRMDAISARLIESVPAMTRSSIVHNDLKLDNCQFDPSDPDHVKSIFDWDMTTLGDPLIDLGTLVQYWPDPPARPVEGTGSPTVPNSDATTFATYPGLADIGLPSKREVADRYAARTGTDISALPWWTAFAYWKTAVVVQQLYNRFARGETLDTRFATYGDRVDFLAQQAERVLDGQGL